MAQNTETRTQSDEESKVQKSFQNEKMIIEEELSNMHTHTWNCPRLINFTLFSIK